jgi:crotonobetainyl-CoA:carnitine CoA-transferase CaiB-like acyl-CoA transferase
MSATMSTTGTLDGIRVMEIGVFMAAPFAALQLADLGADVVKVENISGEPVRSSGPFVNGESSAFLRLNRAKKSLAVDLKSHEGRQAFLRIAAQSDVIIENLRPGAMRTLRLSYDDVREVKPDIIYASASGFGQDGPLAHLPGMDIMAQARGGLMSITGSEGGAPAKVGVPICDLVSALYIALAVTAALRERDRTGEGQYIDVSLYESAVSLAIWEAGRYFVTGEVGKPLGTAHQSEAPYQAIRVADGWVTVGAVTPRTWVALCDALGLESLKDDARFRTSSLRYDNRSELIPLLEEKTMRHRRDELIALLESAAVPCAPISDYGDVFNDSHLHARDFFWDSVGARGSIIRQLGNPMRLSRNPARRDGPGPSLGAHTREVLVDAGYSNAEVDMMIQSGIVSETR